MKFYFEGDKATAICNHCAAVVNTTYVRRNVPFNDGKGEAKDILVAACDTCNAVVAIPAQSTPAIKEARKAETKPIEARLPAIYLDILDYAMQRVTSAASTNHRRIFLSYYLHHFASRPQSTESILTLHSNAKSHYAKCSSTKLRRLSMKVNSEIARDFQKIQSFSHLNQTEILKALIYKIDSDVVQEQKPDVIRNLAAFTAVAG